jgi:hypothetical protein
VSIEIQTEVWRYSKSKGSQRLLLIAIADNCNTESRTAWPTTAYLAGKTLLTQRSIHRLVAELEELGELEIARNRGRNRSNLYRIPRFDATQGDISVEENVTSFHILDDPSYVVDEFVPDDDLATSDEFVTELKCDILSDQSEILSGSNLKSCQIHGDIPATSNHQEPLIEPSLTVSGDLTIPDPLPEWWEILQSIPRLSEKITFEKADAKRVEKGYSTELALAMAEELKAHPLSKQKDRDIYQTWLNWCRRDNGRGIPNPTPLGRAIRTNNAQVDMEELAREIAERKEATQ